MISSTKMKGGLLVQSILFIATISIMTATAIPALKHKKMRDQYQEIKKSIEPVIGSIEKCLGIERKVSSCDTEEKLYRHGLLLPQALLNSSIKSIDFSASRELFSITVTPPETGSNLPFLRSEHTYIKMAAVEDRNGRPIITHWETNPLSGCMKAGYC